MPAALSADDIPALIDSPDFAALSPEKRQEVADNALAAGAQSLRGSWDQQTYQQWGQFADKVRGKVAGMESLGETAAHYGGVVMDAVRGMGRMAIAGAADLGVTEPDASLKAPLGNVAQQGGYWLRKAADTADVLTSGDRSALDARLSMLKHDIDAGNFPLNDAGKLGDWLESRAGEMSAAQKQWYDSVQGDPYPEGYEVTNGLMNPNHAALLSRYLQTRDPGTWTALEKSLGKNPRRAAIEGSQEESLKRSQLTGFLTETFGTDYAEPMMSAGDPLQLALTVLPMARGAKAVAAGMAGTERTAGQIAKGLAKSGAIGAGIGVAEAAVHDPQATWEDYTRAAKDMLAVGMGLHGAGEAAGALAKRLGKRQAQPAMDPADVPPEMADPGPNPFAGPIEAPPQPTEAGGVVPGTGGGVVPGTGGRRMMTPEDIQQGLQELPQPDLSADVTRGVPVKAANEAPSSLETPPQAEPAARQLSPESSVTEGTPPAADTGMTGASQDGVAGSTPAAAAGEMDPNLPPDQAGAVRWASQTAEALQAEGIGTKVGATLASQPISRGRPVIPDAPHGSRDILDYLNQTPLQIPRKGSTSAGELDWREQYEVPAYYRKFIATEGPSNLDRVAQAAFDDGLIRDPSPAALMAEVARAIDTRRTYRAEIRRHQVDMARTEKQAVAFDRSQQQPEGRQAVPTETLAVGDELVIDGETVKVTGVEFDGDGNLTDVTVRDGDRFGVQRIDAQAMEMVLTDEYRPRPDRLEFLPPDEAPMTLESVSAEQLRSEQDAAQRRAAMEQRQQRPLRGSAGEYGTPDMLDPTAGDMALFSRRERRAAEPVDMLQPTAHFTDGPLPTDHPAQPTAAAAPAWTGKLQTLHGIRRALLQAAGLPQAGVGRFARALGIYKARPETVRLQAINDIPVLAHEIGHAIHYRELSPNRGGPADTWGGQYDGELLPMGQPTSAPTYTPDMVRREGVAEFTRLWLTDPAQARAQAPAFSAFWERSLEQRNPRMAQALRDARAMIADYVAMPSFMKARAQIVFDPAAEAAANAATPKQWLQGAYAKWVNTIQPALNVLEQVAKDDPSLAGQAKAVETWMENHRGGWASKAHSDVFGHQTNLQGQRVGAGMAEILKDIPRRDVESFSAYLALKRAAEIEAQGKRSGFEQARLPVAEMEALGARFEKTRQKLLKWQDNALQLLVDAGLLDQASAAAMRKANRDYVPFYRLYEKLNNVSFGPEGSKNGGGYVDLASGIRRLKGSDRAIVDPLQSMMKNAYMFRKLAEQNHIGVQFFDLLREMQGHGKWSEQIRPKMQGRTISHDQIVQKLIDEGVIQNAADLPQHADLTLRLWEAMKRPDTAKGEVIVFKEGQRQHWEVKDPLLMEALKTADADAVKLAKFIGPTMTKFMTLPTRVLRFGATGGPWFAIPNFIRDQFTAGLQSRAGFIPFIDGFRGMMHVMRNSDAYQRWQEAGGRFSGITTSTHAFTSLLEDALPREPGARAMLKSLTNPRHLRDALAYAGHLTEEGTRMGEFLRNKARGASDAEAANASKVVSLNFARAGERGRVANMLIAFTNAKIQELDMVWNLHADPTRRMGTIAKGLMMVTVPSVLTWALGKDDPDIQALPEWRKNLFWNVNLSPIAQALGREKFILSVPKPFLMGAMYGTSVERALDYATGRDPNGARKALGNVLSNVGNPADMAMNLAGLKPIWEARTNWDYFKGRAIIPERMQALPAEAQYDLNTSQTARKIGAAFGVSPMMIDHLVSSYFATAGKWGVGAIDWGMEKLGMADVPAAPAKDLFERPILNRFAGSPYESNEFVRRWYDAASDMEAVMGTWNKQSDQMTTAEQKRWWDKHGAEIQHYNHITNGQTRKSLAGEVRTTMATLSDIGRAMKEIQGSRQISPEAKRSRMMELARQRDQVAEQGFKTLFPESVRRRHW